MDPPLYTLQPCVVKIKFLLSRYPNSVFDNQNRSISHYVALSASFFDAMTEEDMNNDDFFEIYQTNYTKKCHLKICIINHLCITHARMEM